MKKLFTLSKYKKWHKNHLRKSGRKKAKRKNHKPTIKSLYSTPKRKYTRPRKSFHKTGRRRSPIIAPIDLRLLENPEDCLQFFSQIRKKEAISTDGNYKYVEISIKGIKKIDYSTISILKAIGDELKYNKINLRGDFPIDENCMDLIEKSGFLNTMVNEFGQPFSKLTKSEMLFFEKGQGRFTDKDNRTISRVVKEIMIHLTGKDAYCQDIRTILLEICANSIEWSEAENKQWLLGVIYEEKKVIITITDVGKGIIKTLKIKFGKFMKDAFKMLTNDQILFGAFNQKYGSKSEKVNRNKGLPAIKSRFDQGKIQELKVLTNNAILHFDRMKDSRILKKRKLQTS